MDIDVNNIKIHYDKEEEKSSAIVAGSNLVNLINQIKSEGTFAVTCFNTKTNNIIDIKHQIERNPLQMPISSPHTLPEYMELP